jgi:hypothetical protein
MTIRTATFDAAGSVGSATVEDCSNFRPVNGEQNSQRLIALA